MAARFGMGLAVGMGGFGSTVLSTIQLTNTLRQGGGHDGYTLYIYIYII